MPRQSIDRFRDLLKILRPLLPDYLRSHNREPDGSGKFTCLNPDHKDANPSCHFVPETGNERFKCFACGATGDIFQAAHFLEGRPLTGREFLAENVYALAKRFSIKFEEFEVSDQQMRQSEIYRAYQQAASLLAFSDIEEPLQKTYGWTLEQVRSVEPHIGTVKWDDFLNRMREMGDYTATYLEQIGITNKLFDDFRITFAIKSLAGTIVGFASRDTRKKTSKNQQKFYNTPSSVPIYQKSDLLYGLHLARHERGPIYLVEGYADAIALWLSGCKKAVAYMGSAITMGQAKKLQHIGCTDIILVPDNDKSHAGAEAAQQAIQKVFSGSEDFNVAVKVLPPPEGTDKSLDPHDYLSTHSLEDFNRLDEMPAFDWLLGRLDETWDAERQCEQMMPLILDEPRAVRQEDMLTKLAAKTGVRLVALRRDMDRHLEEKRQDVRKKLQRRVDAIRSKLDTIDPDELPSVLRSEALEMEEIQGVKYSSEMHGPDETEAFSKALRKEFWDQGTVLAGWKTGLPAFDDTLGGIPKKECWITFGADGNVGKSAIVQNLGIRVALNNENVAVLHFTIDDTRSQTIPRLIAQMSGLKIQWVRQPQRYPLKAGKHDKALADAWETWGRLVRDGKYDIKDAAQGNTLAFAEEWIDAVRDAHPTWGILFLLDNFHLLSGGEKSGASERERVEALSKNVSLLCKRKGITVISTMELRKRESPSKRPRLSDFKGSSKLEYDVNVGVLVHSEMHANPEDKAEAQAWLDEEDPDGAKRKPVLQLWVDKNKVTSFKGLRELNFRTDTSQVLPRDDGGSGGMTDESGEIDD